MVAETIMGPQAAAAESFRALSPRERLVFGGWKMDGWVRWLAGLRGSYERRMVRMCDILDDQAFQLKQSTPVRDVDSEWGVITKTRLLSFDWPRGGMFVWARVHYEEHPLWQARGDGSVPLFDGPNLAIALLMFFTHKPYLVLPAPGATFGATPEIVGTRAWAYLRLCFAAEDEKNVDLCTEKLMAAMQKFWRIKDTKEMTKLVEEFTAPNVAAEGLDNIGYPMGC